MATPDESSFFEAIGTVTVNFEVLSHAVEQAIWVLLFGNNSQSQIAPIVTSELSYPKSIDMFACLCKYRYPTLITDKELKRICGRLKHAEDKRNYITHSLWLGSESGQMTRFKRTAKRDEGFKVQFQMMTQPELAAIAAEIGQVTKEFYEFVVVKCSKPFENSVGIARGN